MSEQIPAMIARSWSSIPEKYLVRIFDNPAIFAGGGGSGYADPEPFRILCKYRYLYLNIKHLNNLFSIIYKYF